MTQDITSLSLEAALLDQKVAGAFHGKTYAFITVIADKGYALGVAVANEDGYNAISKTFDNEKDARAYADAMNKHIGLTDDEAVAIVISTMGGRRFVQRRTA